MAGLFADAGADAPLRPSDHHTAPRRALPAGPCNYRDAAFGPCGCDQFWDKSSAELHYASAHHRPDSERVPWCVCGHHACFHLRESRAPPDDTLPACNAQSQWPPGTECSLHMAAAPWELARPVEAAHDMFSRRANTTLFPGPSQRSGHPPASEANEPGRPAQRTPTPSQASTSGLPGIPSLCRLSHDRRPAADDEARRGAAQSRPSAAGLGLSMMNLESMRDIDRQQPYSPTVVDDSVPTLPQRASSDSEMPSKLHSSGAEHRSFTSLCGPLQHIREFNRDLELNVAGDTIPNTYDPTEFIQSATEVATPSIAATPDLHAADHAVQEGKSFIEMLTRFTSNMPHLDGSSNKPASVTSVPAQQPPLTNSPSAQQQEQMQTVLRSASPHAFQKLVSYLAPLHNLLNSMPNVASTMRDFSSRLEMLENGSFNYVQPEELHQTLEMYDDRLNGLEHRMDDHDRLHQAIDADHSSSSRNQARIDAVTGSFGSNQSLQSTTSSALILAAMERKDMETELGDIKERLDSLEATAMPTLNNPWEIEVVMLPWGRSLRGIWFSPDQPMHDSARTTTQDSEDWTQVRSPSLVQSLKLPQKNLQRHTDSSPNSGARAPEKGSVFNDMEGGWSSQAISDWASVSSDDWLYPKACGSNNLVYKRLQSRGFVRNISLKGASAREVQATISHTFSDFLPYFKFTEQDEDLMVASHPGLRASFIPLRKVMKDSRLRFLNTAEMTNSALWSVQFLAADVIMRVSGGKKRLYVTQREAYMQQIDETGGPWTWQELRQLPRFRPDRDCQMEDEKTIPEADAKEACWQPVATYDAPPPSVSSSFGSHCSAEISMRPADRIWRRSITPSSILKNRQLQPLSPQSMFHQQRPGYDRNRTVSASAVEQVSSGSSKRRLDFSPVKPSSAPQYSRAPSVPVSRPKRRRVYNSSSPQPDRVTYHEAHVALGNATPRLSQELASPFYASSPPPSYPVRILSKRSDSDVTSRPSQRSEPAIGRSTPSAYATPHSGPYVGGPVYDHGGDTEPDDGNAADDDDQSWPGVTDGDDDNMVNSSDAEAGAQELAASGDDSGFGSESGSDEGPSEEEGATITRRNESDGDDEDHDEPLDTLLNVINGTRPPPRQLAILQQVLPHHLEYIDSLLPHQLEYMARLLPHQLEELLSSLPRTN